MRICYEALAWSTYVNTYERSWDIVRTADHPALGLCIDSFHILSRGSDPAGIRDIPGEKLFFLQLADAPSMDMDLLQWSRHYRLFPGQGAFDLPAFLGHVLRRRLHRAAVARGLQRRLPAVRPGAGRRWTRTGRCWRCTKPTVGSPAGPPVATVPRRRWSSPHRCRHWAGSPSPNWRSTTTAVPQSTAR